MSDDLFDWAEGQRRKDGGKESAADSSKHLELARRIARALAMKHGTTHADAVGRVLSETYGIQTLGPAAGSLFSGSDWSFTGERITSSRKKNNGREIKVWRLTAAAAEETK